MILNKPIITEKTLIDQAHGRYSFFVALNATKGQIAHAFEQHFGIKPLAVNTLKHKGKTKNDQRRRVTFKKTDTKKAFITVPKDTKIDLLTLKTK